MSLTFPSFMLPPLSGQPRRELTAEVTLLGPRRSLACMRMAKGSPPPHLSPLLAWTCFLLPLTNLS